jgi:hypothetical protein
MRHRAAPIAFALTTLVAVPSFAASSFQLTCSNIAFAYSGNAPALDATCLRSNGTPHQSSLILMGISNQNGHLTQGSGASTFQESCGNILVNVSTGGATLEAYCRTTTGSFEQTQLPLDNISNQDGNLTQ